MFDKTRISCTQCRNHKNFKKQPIPCESEVGCPYGKVDLWIGNLLAWNLFELVSGQVIIAGMGDILGIKFEAIEFIFNLYEIHDISDRQELFEKILAIDSVRLKMKNDEMKKNMKPKK